MSRINYFPNDGYCRCRNSSRSCQKCRKKDEAQYDWGVWEWRSDGHYPKGTAIRIFKRRADAERFAENYQGRGGHGIAVRDVSRES